MSSTTDEQMYVPPRVKTKRERLMDRYKKFEFESSFDSYPESFVSPTSKGFTTVFSEVRVRVQTLRDENGPIP